jgi:hypothetical protein
VNLPSVAKVVAPGFGWRTKRGSNPLASASLDVRDFGGEGPELCAGCYDWGHCDLIAVGTPGRDVLKPAPFDDWAMSHEGGISQDNLAA